MINKWKDLSVEERNRYIKFAVSRGITDLNRIKSIYEMPDVQEDIEHMKNSTADFMQRDKDPDRKSIIVPFGHATHKMGRASDSKGGYIYPLVQDTENGLIDFSYNPKSAKEAFNNVVLNAAPYLLPTIGGSIGSYSLSNDNRKYNNGGYLNKYEEGGFEELYRQLHPNNPLPANRMYNGEYIPADMYEDIVNLNTDYNYPYILSTPIITRSTEEPFVPNKSPEFPVESSLQETFPTSNNTPYKDNELSPNKVLEEPDLSYLDELEKLQKTNPELIENLPLILECLSEVSNFNINDLLKTDINRYIPKDDSWDIEVPYNTSPVYFNQDELSPEELLEEPIVKPIINKKPVTKKPSISNEELEKLKFAIDNPKLDIPTKKDFESLKFDTPNSEEDEPDKNKYKEEVYKTPFVRTLEDASYKRGHSLTNSKEAIVFHHTGYEDDPKGNKIRRQFLYDKKAGTSAHVVILEDGTRQIYASPDQVTFHAGYSKLGNRFNVNDFAIGIEFQGNTQKKPLTKEQIESAIEYIKPIIQKNNIPIENLVNHTFIRKSFIKWYNQEKKKFPNIMVYDKDDPMPKKVDYKNDVTDSELARLLKAIKEQIYDKNPEEDDPKGNKIKNQFLFDKKTSASVRILKNNKKKIKTKYPAFSSRVFLFSIL